MSTLISLPLLILLIKAEDSFASLHTLACTSDTYWGGGFGGGLRGGIGVAFFGHSWKENSCTNFSSESTGPLPDSQALLLQRSTNGLAQGWAGMDFACLLLANRKKLDVLLMKGP